MTAMNNSQFEEYVLKLAQSAPAFQPTTTYDPDGDCIEFIVKPDPFYAERIDDLVTVYYSQETKEIVGSLIKGITGLCRRLSEKIPAFKIEIQDGPMRLDHFLFLVKLMSAPASSSDSETMRIPTLTYRKQVYARLIEAAERIDAKAELACV